MTCRRGELSLPLHGRICTGSRRHDFCFILQRPMRNLVEACTYR